MIRNQRPIILRCALHINLTIDPPELPSFSISLTDDAASNQQTLDFVATQGPAQIDFVRQALSQLTPDAYRVYLATGEYRAVEYKRAYVRLGGISIVPLY